MVDEIIYFIEANYQWLIPSFIGFLLLVVTFFKKGGISKADAEKIITGSQVIGSAVSLLMDKEVKKHDKTSSEKESEKTSQD